MDDREEKLIEQYEAVGHLDGRTLLLRHYRPQLAMLLCWWGWTIPLQVRNSCMRAPSSRAPQTGRLCWLSLCLQLRRRRDS